MDNQPNQQPVQPQPQPQYQPPIEPQLQYQPQPQAQPIQPTKEPGKTLTIVGFIMAFVGLGLVGLILSIIGMSKAKKAGNKNGLAIAGIILNTLSIIGFIILALITLNSYSGLVSRAKESQAAQETSSYSSITAIAKTSQAESVASTLSSCAEMYHDANGMYPDQISDFKEINSSCSNSLSDTLTAAIGTTKATYQYSGDFSAADGGKITYWDYTTDKVSESVIYTGSADEYTTFHDIQ